MTFLIDLSTKKIQRKRQIGGHGRGRNFGLQRDERSSLKKKKEQTDGILSNCMHLDISKKNTNTIKSREIRIRTWLEGRGNKLLSLRCRI